LKSSPQFSGAGASRQLHRLLGKKTLEAEILKQALEHATG
jgi:hypothetical protein